MKRTFKVFILIGLAGLFSSCLFMGPSVKGDGDVVEEVRHPGSFNGVKVTSGMNVYLIQGGETRVIVVADKNLHEVIETVVVDGTLEIRALANIWNSSSKKVMVYFDKVREIEATAGSNIYTGSRLVLDQVDLRASAGSNFQMDLESDLINVSVSSGANILLEGQSKQITARTSSGGNLKAEDFRADISDIKASSGANAWITAMKEITAHASSGGNIFYYGTPQTTNTSASSGGNVHKR